MEEREREKERKKERKKETHRERERGRGRENGYSLETISIIYTILSLGLERVYVRAVPQHVHRIVFW